VFVWGSIVDGIFWFLFYLARELATVVVVADLIAMVIFVIRECNSQQIIVHTVLDSFICGRFNGKENGFQAALK
jgi:hypothetical protein